MERDLSMNMDISDEDDDSNDDDDDMSDIDENDIQNLMKDKETSEMMKMLQQLGQQEAKKSTINLIGDEKNDNNKEQGTKHNKNESSGENTMWSHFLNAKQSYVK